VHILAVSAGPEAPVPVEGPPAPALDRDAMEAAARAGGGALRLVTVDGSDVRALSRDIATSLVRAPTQEGERWRDDGYLLLPLIALLMLPLFRRGGAVALD
jgi:Ca-activated chloride channel family protein